MDQSTKWEQNKWYLLATLYGVADRNSDRQLKEKNRTFWNRYFSGRLSTEEKNWLLSTGRCPKHELIPLAEQDIRDATINFLTRQGETINFDQLPEPQRMEFHNIAGNDKNVSFYAAGYIFTEEVDVSDTEASYFDLSECTFFREVWFDRVTLDWFPCFANAQFKDWFHLCNSEVKSFLNFSGAKFMSFVDFSTTKFSAVSFRNALFSRNANFINSEFRGPSHFDGARFGRDAPEFHGAKMHESTTWFGTQWPVPGRFERNPERYISAYERLKLEMDRLKRHEDEIDFFVLELRSKSALCAYEFRKSCFDEDPLGNPRVKPMLELRQSGLFGSKFYVTVPHLNWSVARMIAPHKGTLINVYGILSVHPGTS
jgi:uncharacterized protein YjbI with pentapeptide repeats